MRRSTASTCLQRRGMHRRPTAHLQASITPQQLHDKTRETACITAPTCLASAGPLDPCSTKYLQMASMRSAAATQVPPNLCTCGRATTEQRLVQRRLGGHA